MELGDRVSFDQEMKRTLGKAGVTTWEPTIPFSRVGQGLYIGYRHKQQGHYEGGNYPDGEGAYFKETGPRIKVALVVVNVRSNPVVVPFDNIRKVEE